jgi:hypothetical protein
MISTGRWLEPWEADAERRVVAGGAETFSARVSSGSLASPEEPTVRRLLDDRRTHDLIYLPDAGGNFMFQCKRER